MIDALNKLHNPTSRFVYVFDLLNPQHCLCVEMENGPSGKAFHDDNECHN